MKKAAFLFILTNIFFSCISLTSDSLSSGQGEITVLISNNFIEKLNAIKLDEVNYGPLEIGETSLTNAGFTTGRYSFFAESDSNLIINASLFLGTEHSGKVIGIIINEKGNLEFKE